MMGGYYSSKASRLRFAPPSTRLWVLGGIALLLAGACLLARSVLHFIPALFISLGRCAAGALLVACSAAVVAVVVWLALPPECHIRHLVRRGLFCPAFGNPLHLKDGELLPRISCAAFGNHRYILTIRVRSCTAEAIKALASFISSSCLVGRYQDYAVTAVQVDESFTFVDFAIENVKIDKRMVVHDISEMRTDTNI